MIYRPIKPPKRVLPRNLEIAGERINPLPWY
jgi:hypothetical protein